MGRLFITEISSASNEHFRRWNELSTSKGLRKHHEFILMGERLIREFLQKPGFAVRAEILAEGMTAVSQAPVFKLSNTLFKELDVVGTHFNLLVLEAKKIPEVTLSAAPEGLEIFSPLGDPGNLGALARSALAFGASRLVLSEEAAHPFLPKAIKASAGAILHLPLFRTRKISEILTELSGLYGLDMEGQDLSRFTWPANLRLLIGEEGAGLPSLPFRQRIKIATGPVESLNATVAASIALYSYAQSRK